MSQSSLINYDYSTLLSSATFSTATELDWRPPSADVFIYRLPCTPNTDWRMRYNELVNRYIDQANALQKSVIEAKKYKKQLETCRQHDLAPVMHLVFHDNDVTIRPRQGRHPRLMVKFEEGMYVCYWGKRIVGFSSHRDGMLKEVNDTMVFLWSEYVTRFEAKNCTKDARQLHTRLVKNFEEC